MEPTSPVDEGLDVTVTCIHDLPNGSISWLKNDELQEGENKNTFQIKIILKNTNITCMVKSDCGDIKSTITITVKGDYTAHNFCLLYIFFDTVKHLGLYHKILVNNVNNSNINSNKY